MVSTLLIAEQKQLFKANAALWHIQLVLHIVINISSCHATRTSRSCNAALVFAYMSDVSCLLLLTKSSAVNAYKFFIVSCLIHVSVFLLISFNLHFLHHSSWWRLTQQESAAKWELFVSLTSLIHIQAVSPLLKEHATILQYYYTLWLQLPQITHV